MKLNSHYLFPLTSLYLSSVTLRSGSFRLHEIDGYYATFA